MHDARARIGLGALLLAATAARAQAPGPVALPLPAAVPAVTNAAPVAPAAPAKPAERTVSVNFLDAPLDQVLALYGELTGRTVIRAPGINASVTLRAQQPLTQIEALHALDTALALQNIALVPMGEKFLKVVQTAAVRQEGLSIERATPGETLPATDTLVSQIVELKYLDLAEVQPILQGLIHPYGKLQPLERTNGLLVTDTAANLQRILEIVAYLDHPVTSKVETRIYELHYAEAAKVAARLNELIADTQNQQGGPRVVVTRPSAPNPPGVIRATPRVSVTEVEMAERGIISGKVKIVADERTNVLIIITEPPNFIFFDKIVAVLDRQVEPEVILRVYQLEYADAEEVSTILNNFLGKTTSQPERPAGTPDGENTGAAARSQALRDFIAQRLRQNQPQTAGETAATGSIGEISANTKILADKRSNALLLMGRKADVVALEDVVQQLDVMLAQVLIEAVILEVNLSDNLTYGIDWLQRSLQFYDEKTRGGVTISDPVSGFGGGFASHASPGFTDGGSVGRDIPLSAGALTYYLTMYDLNLDTIIRLAAGSSDAHILSTPVVLTADNTEAKITAGEERPVVTTTSVTSGGTQTSAYEYKNIGIELTVTPRINPQQVVVMEVTQTADNVGDIVQIDGNDVPVITKRELKAQITVPDRSTIVLGGLVSKSTRKARTKVPLLGDIPILGRLFRSDDNQNSRAELLVLITPYVIVSPEQARAETRRLHKASGAVQTDWYKQWSDGDLARELRKEDEERIRLRRKRNSNWFWQRHDKAAPADGTGDSAAAPAASVTPAPATPPDATPPAETPKTPAAEGKLHLLPWVDRPRADLSYRPAAK